MIRFANKNDLELLHKFDKHISKKELEISIQNQKILVAYEQEIFLGWLRYNLFWDNTPFMNLLFILDKYQRKGYGKQLVIFWEEEMKKQGFSLVLTSTLSTETAQYFYKKIGYEECGSFILPHEPSEIILFKKLEKSEQKNL